MFRKGIKAYTLSFYNSFNKWRYNLKEYDHLNKLFNAVNRKEILNKKIVFNTIRISRDHLDEEFFLGKILSLNGAKVKMLLDDGVLKHWETSPYDDNKKDLYSLLKKLIIKKGLKTYKDRNLEIIYYSEILKNINYNNWRELKDYALSSTIRFFQTSELNFNDEKIKEYYNLSLINSVFSSNIGEFVLNKIKPDYFVTTHGIYSIWGPAYDFLKNNGVKSLILARFHSHSLDPQDVYFTYAKCQTLSRCKFWQMYKNTPVTEHMKQKVTDLFNHRINHKTKDTELYYKKKTKIYEINKDNDYKYHIAIFPSLIWDGNIQDRHIAFTGIIDWLMSTIDYLKKRKDIMIYLKFHPAEVSTFKKSAKIQVLIKKYLDKEKIENLELIPTEERIDPYEFLKSGIDLGICYDGVLALEMPYLKIPVLLGGVRGRFAVPGGNFSINDKKEYFEFLKNLDKYIEVFHKNYDEYWQNIVRYSYWYLFENVIKMPTISKVSQKKWMELLYLKMKDIKLDKKLFQIFNE